MNRFELKKQAREYIERSVPKPIAVGLGYVVLTVIVAVLCGKLLGAGITAENLAQYTEHVMNGNYEYATEYLNRIQPPFSSQSVALLLRLMVTIVSVGFMIFLLNTIRGTGACFGNLLDGFGFFWKIIWLTLLEGLFVFLWSLLLIVPGIIAAYKYRMAFYLLIDHPEYSTMQCLRESKAMMYGHKMELFELDLSFLGWFLLAGFPVVGHLVQIWTTPFFGMTYALYYEQLRGGDTMTDSWNSVTF